MGVTAVGGNNAGLNARAATFAKGIVVELVGRPHQEVYHQERLIPSKIDLYMKMMPSPNNFVGKSAAPGQVVQQENYKLIIQSVIFIIRT